MASERLQKVLAHAGVASRRAVEALILQGRVRVNGARAEIGVQVDPTHDRIEVDGRHVRLTPTAHQYLMFNKPDGVVSTVSDPQGRPTLRDYVRVPARVYPVGRLDLDSEGLLLLSDDGELTYRLTQARYEVEKEYLVEVAGEIGSAETAVLRRGVYLEDGFARPVKVDLLEQWAGGALMRVVLHEGRKREVRRMLLAVGGDVTALRRTRIGPLRLGTLPLGQWRHLAKREVHLLRVAVGLDQPSRRAPEDE